MAITILPAAESQLGVSVKNLTTGASVYYDLKSVEASIDIDAELHVHRLDHGGSVIDAKVIKPVAINVDGFFTELSQLEDSAKVMQSRQDYYSVTINGTTWDNLVATNISIDQSGQFLSVSPFSLTFFEIMIEQFDYVPTEQPGDSPARDRGNVQAGEAIQNKGQVFDEIKSRI